MNDRKERGMVLVIAMLMIAVIAGFGIAYIATSTAQSKMVYSSVDESVYLETAQAGFDMSRVFLMGQFLTSGNPAWDAQLLTCSLLAYNEFTAPIDVTPATITTTFQWRQNITYQGNTFVAEIINDSDGGVPDTNDTNNTLVLKVWAFGSTATAADRAAQANIPKKIMLQTLVQYKSAYYEPTSAVVVGGSLKVYGSATIGGSDGNIQANGNVEVGAASTVTQNIYSTGTITAPGVPADQQFAGAPPVDIPPISPTRYASACRYWLRTTGDILDTFDPDPVTQVKTAASLGWSYSSGLWSYNSGTAYNGSYYSVAGTNVKITGSPGTTAVPWQATIISEGYIDVSGSPKMIPYTNNVALMAGGDLEVSGSASNPFTGLFAAHEQIKLTGTPTFNGVLIAQDHGDSCSKVSTGSQFDVTMGGNISITYNGGMTTLLEDGDPYIKIKGIKKTVR
ncbi:MAG: hypothetical protein V1701_01215 [Planctomycetota bacterium]